MDDRRVNGDQKIQLIERCRRLSEIGQAGREVDQIIRQTGCCYLAHSLYNLKVYIRMP